MTLLHRIPLLASAILLVACGLKAPLYMPRAEPPAAGAQASPTTGELVRGKPGETAPACPADRAGSGDEPECAGLPAKVEK